MSTTSKPCVAIVIGTGAKLFKSEALIVNLSNAGLTNLREVDLKRWGHGTPFGDRNCDLIRYECDQGSIIVCYRHGVKHFFPPSGLNFDAMFYALNAEDVTHYWAATACGSLNGFMVPGSLVLANQCIDFTRQRNSFFGQSGPAVHLPLADPTCLAQNAFLARIAAQERVSVIHRLEEMITALCITGPEFGTRAESYAWKALGAQLVAMTIAREAKRARACGFCSSWFHLVCDFDSWRLHLAGVTAAEVEAILPSMVERVSRIFQAGIVELFLGRPNSTWSCQCRAPLMDACHTRGLDLRDYSWLEEIASR